MRIVMLLLGMFVLFEAGSLKAQVRRIDYEAARADTARKTHGKQAAVSGWFPFGRLWLPNLCPVAAKFVANGDCVSGSLGVVLSYLKEIIMNRRRIEQYD